MATGPEHYRKAEELLELADHALMGSDLQRYYLSSAQIRATLANAASRALVDYDGWAAVALNIGDGCDQPSLGAIR